MHPEGRKKKRIELKREVEQDRPARNVTLRRTTIEEIEIEQDDDAPGPAPAPGSNQPPAPKDRDEQTR